jgi:predicted transcriptional regulator
VEEFKLFNAESKFLNIIWELEPINSTELAKECLEKLGWKKSTTYTMLRKLSERNIVKNETTMVTSLIKREQVQKMESEALLEKSFGNSLPSFLAAFLQGKKITEKEVDEIKKMVEEAME